MPGQDRSMSESTGPADLDGGWVRLSDLREGAIFETQNAVRAVKSEYCTNHPDGMQADCFLLESGEYAHFPERDNTLVRELEVFDRQAAWNETDEFVSWMKLCNVIRSDGTFNEEQAKRELFDYHGMLTEVSKVYDHVTRGRISKPNTVADAVIAIADEIFNEDADAAIREQSESGEVEAEQEKGVSPSRPAPRPAKRMDSQQLLAVLGNIQNEIAHDASYGGSLEYEAADEPGKFDVRAAYRIGNDMGQGGMRLI